MTDTKSATIIPFRRPGQPPYVGPPPWYARFRDHAVAAAARRDGSVDAVASFLAVLREADSVRTLTGPWRLEAASAAEMIGRMLDASGRAEPYGRRMGEVAARLRARELTVG